MSVPFALDRPDIVFEAIVDVLLQVNPGVSRAMLLSAKREEGGTAQLRQMAMALMGDDCTIEPSIVATYFGRDRTTVRHAIFTVRNWRDRPAFDAVVGELYQQVFFELDRYATLEREGNYV